MENLILKVVEKILRFESVEKLIMKWKKYGKLLKKIEVFKLDGVKNKYETDRSQQTMQTHIIVGARLFKT